MRSISAKIISKYCELMKLCHNNDRSGLVFFETLYVSVACDSPNRLTYGML